jgi:hypothetical protein
MKTDPTFNVIQVTPEMAKEWLQKLDPDQRHVRKYIVDQYVRDMISGAWRLTHQPIAFDTEDRLIDGQHRLHAVVASEQTVEMTVARNISGGYGLPVDVGFRRTAKDLLHLPDKIISASGVLRRLQLGTIRHSQRSTISSVDEIRDTYEKYRDDVDASCAAISKGMATSASAGAIAFARPIDQTKVDRFIESVRTGAGLASGSPALQLRNWLTRNGGGRSSADNVMATLSAIHAELKGVSIAALHTSHSGYESICAKRRALHIRDTPLTANRTVKSEISLPSKILEILNERGETSYADICAETGAPTAVVSDTLYKMKKRGLVCSSSPKHWDLLADAEKPSPLTAEDFKRRLDALGGSSVPLGNGKPPPF